MSAKAVISRTMQYMRIPAPKCGKGSRGGSQTGPSAPARAEDAASSGAGTNAVADHRQSRHFQRPSIPYRDKMHHAYNTVDSSYLRLAAAAAAGARYRHRLSLRIGRIPQETNRQIGDRAPPRMIITMIRKCKGKKGLTNRIGSLGLLRLFSACFSRNRSQGQRVYHISIQLCVGRGIAGPINILSQASHDA